MLQGSVISVFGGLRLRSLGFVGQWYRGRPWDASSSLSAQILAWKISQPHEGQFRQAWWE